MAFVELDVGTPDGRTLHAYDTGDDGGRADLVVVWHHGTPNLGAPPEPLFDLAAQLGVRWISYDRPGYGGSTPNAGRDFASAAADVAAVADALGVRRFGVFGHSSGGPHAMACAAGLPDRVLAAVSVSGLAPYRTIGLEWYAGMAPSAAAQLRAAVDGRAALTERLRTTDFDPDVFTPEDHAALGGDWAWLGRMAGQAIAGGIGGMVDDELANVAVWGFDPGRIRVRTLMLHGAADRSVPVAHSRWLADRIRDSEFWELPREGHISALRSADAALDWLARAARAARAASAPPTRRR